MEINIYAEVQNLQKRKNWFLSGRNHLAISLIQKHVSQSHYPNILDVGCSEGGFLASLQEKKFDFTGIDINQSALDLCKNYGCQDKVRYGDAREIPFGNDTFDVVTLLDIIEHIEEDDKALREARRVCKPGGMILLFVPAHQWLWSTSDDVYHHKRRYSKEQIEALVKKEDLQIKITSYFNTFLFVPFLAVVFVKKIQQDRKALNVLKMVPRPIDFLFRKLMQLESFLISRWGWSLPFGSSIIVVAKKA